MAEVTWKDLAKAIDDLTKISDEIDSKLVTHNTDESAHSQSNEAIYNHRVGEVLDHLDRSVTINKLDPNRFSFVVDWRTHDGLSIDNYLTTGPKLGSILLATQSGSIETRYVQISAGANFYIDFAQESEFETNIKISFTTSQEIIFGVGNLPSVGDTVYYGFKVVDGSLYATHYDYDTGIEVLTEITGVTLTNKNRYRAVYDPGVSVKFYVNDVLKVTHTTNLIETYLDGNWWGLDLKSTTTSQRRVLIYPVNVLMDL